MSEPRQVALVIGAGDHDLGFAIAAVLVKRGIVVFGTQLQPRDDAGSRHSDYSGRRAHENCDAREERLSERSQAGARRVVLEPAESDDRSSIAGSRSAASAKVDPAHARWTVQILGEQRSGVQMIALPDVREASLRQMLRIIRRRTGSVQVSLLVVCIGFRLFGIFEEIPPAEFERATEDWMALASRTVRLVVPEMRLARSGKVAFVFDWTTNLSVLGSSAHHMLSGALHAFGIGIRQELLHVGINVFSVLVPGVRFSSSAPTASDFRIGEYSALRQFLSDFIGMQFAYDATQLADELVTMLLGPIRKFTNYLVVDLYSAALLLCIWMLPERAVAWLIRTTIRVLSEDERRHAASSPTPPLAL